MPLNSRLQHSVYILSYPQTVFMRICLLTSKKMVLKVIFVNYSWNEYKVSKPRLLLVRRSGTKGIGRWQAPRRVGKAL